MEFERAKLKLEELLSKIDNLTDQVNTIPEANESKAKLRRLALARKSIGLDMLVYLNIRASG